MEIFNWIVEHYGQLSAALVGLIGFATIVVGLTPSQKDDAVLAKVVAILDWFSLLNPKKPAGPVE